MPNHDGMGYPEDVPRLTDGVVTLRGFTLDDLDGCVETCNDPESIAWTRIPVPYGREEGITWITKRVTENWAAGTDLGLAIEAEFPDGQVRFAGTIGLVMQEDGIADLGFLVHPAVRGYGVARRAIALAADYAFDERGIDVLTWYAYVGNWASRRVVWANGFSFDGTIAGFRLQRGRRRDSWFGTLRAGDSREPKTRWWTPPVLESSRLRLRPFADSDDARLYELLHDERSQHFGGRIKGVVQPDGVAQLLRAREQCARGTMINWCIADRSTDQLVGGIQLFDLEGLDDTEVKPGYTIHPDSRGRGYLTEALTTLTDWIFRPIPAGGFGKRLITISTAASNGASRHAASSAGFTHTATHPHAFPIGATDFDDEVIYQRRNLTWQPGERG
jgi:RimJ/RimL family protein N-acetyltransferase